MKEYLRNITGKELKEMESEKNGNSYSLHLIFHSRESACRWLDELLRNKKMKEFKIPGSEQGNAAKMKVKLLCDPVKLP